MYKLKLYYENISARLVAVNFWLSSGAENVDLSFSGGESGSTIGDGRLG